MTLENFKNSFESQKSWKMFFNKILCLVAIGISLFLTYSVFVNLKSKSLLFLAIWLLILGTYGLYELRNHYKITYFENNLSKEQNIKNVIALIRNIAKGNYHQNENSFDFIYQRSWWRMDYKVTIFVSENVIGINAEGRGSSNSGFIDFGASRRTEQKIINLLLKNTSR